MFKKTGDFDLSEDLKYHNVIKEQYRELVHYNNPTCIYIRKDVANEFLALGEYKTETLASFVSLKMKVDGVDQMGDNSMFERFGGMFEDDVIMFYASSLDLVELNILPQEEDLIFVPKLNNRIYVITKADDKAGVKYNHGYGDIGWRYTTKLYSPNLTSTINTGNTEFDDDLSDIKTRLNIKTNDVIESNNVNDTIVITTENPFDE